MVKRIWEDIDTIGEIIIMIQRVEQVMKGFLIIASILVIGLSIWLWA